MQLTIPFDYNFEIYRIKKKTDDFHLNRKED